MHSICSTLHLLVFVLPIALSLRTIHAMSGFPTAGNPLKSVDFLERIDLVIQGGKVIFDHYATSELNLLIKGFNKYG